MLNSIMRQPPLFLSDRSSPSSLGTAATAITLMLCASLTYGQSLVYNSGEHVLTSGDYPDPITSIRANGAETLVTGTNITVNNSSGHAFWGTDGATFNLTDVTLNGSGNYASGIRLEGASTLIANRINATVTASAMLSEQRGAIDLPGFNGDPGVISTAEVYNSNLSATGSYVHGVFATGGNSVRIENSTISTDGELAAGLYAYGGRHGVGTLIQAKNVTITTAGNQGYGLYAAYPSSGAGTLVTENAVVTTHGAGAFGIYSRHGGKITATDGSITTSGAGAHGVRVAPLEAAGVDGSIHLENVAVTTKGANADAYRIDQEGELTVIGGSGSAQHANSSGVSTTIGATATFEGVSIHSKGAGIRADFADPTYNLASDNTVTTVSLNNGTHVTSDSGNLLVVQRTVGATAAAETAGFVLNVGSGSSATGNIYDTGSKTTGYLDINVASGGRLTSDVISGFRDMTIDGSLFGKGTLELEAGTSLAGTGSVAHNVTVNGGTLGTDLKISGVLTLGEDQQENVGSVSDSYSVDSGKQANITTASAGASIDATAGTAHIGTMTAGATLTVGNWGASIENLDGGTINAGSGTVSATNVTGGNVNSGGLSVNNDFDEGDIPTELGNLAVNAGASLSGNGIILANTAISGGQLNPGNSPGMLVFAGDLSLDDDTVTTFELTGIEDDLIRVLGDLKYGGILSIFLAEDYLPVLDDLFTLFDGFQTQEGMFSDIVFNRSGYEGVFDYENGTLLLTAVPEPATYAAILSLLALGVAYRMKRKSTVS